MSEDKAVRVSPETHRRLEQLGAKGESFNHVITRLIASYVSTHPHAAELLHDEEIPL